jgi:hypothetical protein
LRQIWGRLKLVLVQYYCCVFSCKPGSRSRCWGGGGGGGFFVLFFLGLFSVLILLRSLASRSFQSFGFCGCRCARARARVCVCVWESLLPCPWRVHENSFREQLELQLPSFSPPTLTAETCEL